MKQARVIVTLVFDMDQITYGPVDDQVFQAIQIINGTLQRQPYGLGAQMTRIYAPPEGKEIKVDVINEEETGEVEGDWR